MTFGTVMRAGDESGPEFLQGELGFLSILIDSLATAIMTQAPETARSIAPFMPECVIFSICFLLRSGILFDKSLTS